MEEGTRAMKLTITREQWLRGNGVESALRRPEDGKMCCLGFFALACGMSVDEIQNFGDPSDTVGETLLKWPQWLVRELPPEDDELYASWHNTDECGNLIEANDSKEIEEPDRERKIAALFADHGVEVEFVDGAPSGEG